jgi:hypothetical protein
MSPGLELQEKRASACLCITLFYISLTRELPGIQAGGIFVNEAARKFLAVEFHRGEVAEADVLPLPELEEEFEHGKKAFADPHKDNIKLRVGPARLNVGSINVKRGTLTLDGYGIRDIFSCGFKALIVLFLCQGASLPILLSSYIRYHRKCQWANARPFRKSKPALGDFSTRLMFVQKYIMLVGGFGDSHYLHGEIRKNFCETAQLLLANSSL